MPAKIIPIVEFISGYRICYYDSRNYVIEYVTEDGNWKIQGYYGDLRSLARAIIKICSINQVDSKDLIDQMNELVNKFDEKLAELEDKLSEVIKDNGRDLRKN